MNSLTAGTVAVLARATQYRCHTQKIVYRGRSTMMCAYDFVAHLRHINAIVQGLTCNKAFGRI